jgi:hypothetical protein
MGLGIVLLFWAVVGTVVAGIAAVTFGCATALLTRGVTSGRRKAIIAGSMFPLVCLGWGGAIFVFQAVVNEGLLHRDLGLGDTWHAPLANGYQIMMIDVTDQGWVYNPKTQPGSAVGEQADAVAGVRDLGKDTNQVDSYFLLDTQLGHKTQFQNYGALRHRALELGIEPNLQPIYNVYSKFRFSWFDVLAGLLFCIPPVIGVLLLTGWIVRLRRTRTSLARTLSAPSPL